MRHGFLLIDKPTGPTSHDIVADARSLLGERKIGHLGTLDPGASGLLILAVGAKALKTIEFFRDLKKEYEATVCFGSVSTTYDAQGVIEPFTMKPGVREPDTIAVRRAIEEQFTGVISQVPPAHSAVHVSGTRAYQLAREGKLFELPPRQVEITACEILSFAYPELRLRVACSSGTYIRSLAHDLGHVLRCGGYLSALRRTRVGQWNVQDAAPPEDIAWSLIIPLKEALPFLPSIDVTSAEFSDLRLGRNIAREIRPDTLAWHDGLPVAILEPAKDGTRMAHPRKVL